MYDQYYDDPGVGSFRLFDFLRRQMGVDFGEELTRSGNQFTREGDRLVLRTELPGMRPEEVDVTVHGRTITIRGERKDDTPDGYRVLRKERGPYRVSRTMTVPLGAKTDNVDVELRNGVLTLRFEISIDLGPRKIELNQSPNQSKSQEVT
jgi:HSP20 family protein